MDGGTDEDQSPTKKLKKQHQTATTPSKYSVSPSVGISPQQKAAKQCLRRAITFMSVSPKKVQKSPKWNRNEEAALVQFISLHRDLQHNPESEWPLMKPNHSYWLKADAFICEVAKMESRGASAIRSRVNYLSRRFKTVGAAEAAFGITVDYLLGNEPTDTPSPVPAPELVLPLSILSNVDALTADQQRILATRVISLLNEDDILHVLSTIALSNKNTATLVKSLAKKLDKADAGDLLDGLFVDLANRQGIKLTDSFIPLSLIAMKKLQNAGKNNIVNDLPRCIALQRPDSSESLMPMNRMPFGLIEYQIEFFNAKNINEEIPSVNVPRRTKHKKVVHESHDFALWRQTLDAELTQRQNQIITGPGWSGNVAENRRDPLEARVNIACRSRKTVLQKLKSVEEYSTKPIVQIGAIKKIQAVNPDGRFWLKLDGVDIKAAAQESMKGKWNGDVDLSDGKLEALRNEYDERRENFLSLVRVRSEDVVVIIKQVSDALDGDNLFLTSGLERSVAAYQRKLKIVNTQDETLKCLNWDIVEFTTLISHCQQFVSHFITISDRVASMTIYTKQVQDDAVSIKDDFFSYLRNCFKKRREPPASHVLVVMISDEERKKKPYAAPVQYIPYHSLKDQYVRDITKAIKVEMCKRGLKLIGTVTDGEFCSLRSQGETRPIHLWQLVHDSREAVSKMTKKTLLEMLIPVDVDAQGNAVVQRPNSMIPNSVKVNIFHERQTGVSVEDSVSALRRDLVVPGQEIHSWKAGQPESLLDKLRSILATLYYRQAIDDWQEKGVDFQHHIYVPEVDPTTGIEHHERADHCHLLKRIANHTRTGAYQVLEWDAFDEAMLNPNTGLTEPALRGTRKQSVKDAELLLSHRVASFMEARNFITTANYVRMIACWHEASDGRGLTQLQRCRFNNQMLQYLLDELMPVHREVYDFKMLDINRPWGNVRGFSRETLVEITTNIESQELRRCQSSSLGYVEHPRAGTTDDVEAFFSLCHRHLGDHFTLMDFKNRWLKLVSEFSKKMDDNLPFYYWTLNERYQQEQPSFDERPDYDENDVQSGRHPLRLHRLKGSTREDSSIFTAGRSFLPVRNRQSVRQRFHRIETGLPPVPDHLQIELPQL